MDVGNREEITKQIGTYFNNFSRGTQQDTWREFIRTFGGAIKELDKPYITHHREIRGTPANINKR